MILYQNHSITGLHAKSETKIICFTNFSETTAPQLVKFQGKHSTIIIFKLCRFNVNLWTFCFVLGKST